jgi:hypothetical protein
MDAFDADVLIYAGAAGHPLGKRVRALFPVEPDSMAGVGSVLLLPEVLAKPMRDGSVQEVAALAGLLGRLDLRTEVARFITNNRRDFPVSISDVEVTLRHRRRSRACGVRAISSGRGSA